MNLKREYQGLPEALRFFKIPKATIVTLNQEDEFIEDGVHIDVIPAYKYFSFTVK